MNIHEYIEKRKKIQEKIIIFIDSQYNEEENYENLINLIKDQQIETNKYEMKMLLLIINQISNNHYRNINFFAKFEKLLMYFQSKIQKELSSYEIFSIFEQNKRILLFLLESKIIEIDEKIFHEMAKITTFREYFAPEIKKFIEENINKFKYTLFYSKINESIENFNEKRKKGENENYICEMIRNDSIEEFITYVKQNDYSLNNYIEKSIFETNPLLIDKKTSLIEYSAFFGSIQIFKYLYKNEVKLTESLWVYAVHGDNEEIIHILDENEIFPEEEEEEKVYKFENEKAYTTFNYDYDSDYSDDQFFLHNYNKPINLNKVENDNSFLKCIIESIKCHCNDAAFYIEQNFYQDKKKNFTTYGFQFYNFDYINDEIINNEFLSYALIYDYYTIVTLLLENKDIDINTMIKYQILLNLIFYGVFNFFFFL